MKCLILFSRKKNKISSSVEFAYNVVKVKVPATARADYNLKICCFFGGFFVVVFFRE